MNLSKHLVLTLFLLAFSVQKNTAQIKQQDKDFDFFLATHLQIWDYVQLGGSINYLSSNGHGFQLNLSLMERDKDAEPKDAHYCPRIILPFSDPMDRSLLLELRYQKRIYQKNPRFRVLAAAGLSWGNYVKITYLDKDPFSGCYSTGFNSSPAFGFSARLTADFPVFRATGLQLSLNTNINKEMTTLGPELSWTFGRVRSKM